MAIVPKTKKATRVNNPGFVMDRSNNKTKSSALLTSDGWDSVMHRIGKIQNTERAATELAKVQASRNRIQEMAQFSRTAKDALVDIPATIKIATTGDFYQMASHYALQAPRDRAAQFLARTAEVKFKRYPDSSITMGEIKSWAKSASQISSKSAMVDAIMTEGLVAIASNTSDFENKVGAIAKTIANQEDFDRHVARLGWTTERSDHRFARLWLAKKAQEHMEKAEKAAAPSEMGQGPEACMSAMQGMGAEMPAVKDKDLVQPNAGADPEVNKTAQQDWVQDPADPGQWRKSYGGSAAAFIYLTMDKYLCYFSEGGPVPAGSEDHFDNADSLAEAKEICDDEARNNGHEAKVAQSVEQIPDSWVKEEIGEMECWSIPVSVGKARICKRPGGVYMAELYDASGAPIYRIGGEDSFLKVEKELESKVDELASQHMDAAAEPESEEKAHEAHLVAYTIKTGADQVTARVKTADGKLVWEASKLTEKKADEECATRRKGFVAYAMKKSPGFTNVAGQYWVSETGIGRAVIAKVGSMYNLEVFEARASIDSPSVFTREAGTLRDAMKVASLLISKTAGAWDVFLHGSHIDTVFDGETDPEEVKKSLINHDGYDSAIEVKLSKEASKTAQSKIKYEKINDDEYVGDYDGHTIMVYKHSFGGWGARINDDDAGIQESSPDAAFEFVKDWFDGHAGTQAKLATREEHAEVATMPDGVIHNHKLAKQSDLFIGDYMVKKAFDTAYPVGSILSVLSFAGKSASPFQLKASVESSVWGLGTPVLSLNQICAAVADDSLESVGKDVKLLKDAAEEILYGE